MWKSCILVSIGAACGAAITLWIEGQSTPFAQGRSASAPGLTAAERRDGPDLDRQNGGPVPTASSSIAAPTRSGARGAPAAAFTTRSTLPTATTPAPEPESPTAGGTAQESRADPDAPDAGAPGLPEVYEKLVEPPESRAPRIDELHARFAREPRDQVWAYTMELGINQAVASSRGTEGTVIEYVECRSRYCEIAGYVQPGYTNMSTQMIASMRRSGWWQLGGGTVTSSSDIDGTERFVTIIPRDDADGIRPSGSGPHRESESTTRGAEREPSRA